MEFIFFILLFVLIPMGAGFVGGVVAHLLLRSAKGKEQSAEGAE